MPFWSHRELNEPSSRPADREPLIKAVQERIAKASRGPGYPPLGWSMMPSELRAAAEAAVDEMARR